MFSFLTLLPLLTLTTAVPQARSSDCVGTITSLSDVSAAVECTTINIHSFIVPAGKTFALSLKDNTIVNVLGDIQFGNKSWGGPLFEIQGNDITFNGNHKVWDGGGPFHWDGEGSSGGATKPCPMMSVQMSGTMSAVYVANSPVRAFSIDPPGQLVVSDCTVDDSEGNSPNAKSGDHSAGRNTDGFDISGDDITIKGCTVINQDDCITINKGKNITVEDNYCESGHGISIGSIKSNAVVENVLFQSNKIVDSVQAFRIKTQKSATNGQVKDITYRGNTATNCTQYGVIIDQSYPDTLGTPGNGVQILNVNFVDEETDVSVTDKGVRVAVNCGYGSCGGAWSWSLLHTSGGKAGPMTNADSLDGYSS